MSAKKTLPSLHVDAIRYKNQRRLQHDGGRAWIKDSQLNPAVRKPDLRLRHELKGEIVKG